MVDPVLIPAILSLTFGGIIGIISQIQHSRCSSIKCWGCECIRKVKEDEEEDKKNKLIHNAQEVDIVSPNRDFGLDRT